MSSKKRPMLFIIPDDEPDYSDQLLPRSSSPSTLENCTLPPEYFQPPPPVEIPLPDKAKIKKMKKKDEDEDDFAEEEEDEDEVMEIDPETGFVPFKDIKKEERDEVICWEDDGDEDEVVVVEAGPSLERSRRNSNESAVSSTTGNSNKEEMAKRKEYREYKRKLRARRLAKRNSNTGNAPSTSRGNVQPQPQNNGFGQANDSTSANCHPSNYFQSPSQYGNASSANLAPPNAGNNFQQQFPSQQAPTSGFQQPPPRSRSNSTYDQNIPPQAPNNDPQQESAATAAPNRFSNPNNSIHIDLGSMPQFAENNDNAAAGAGGNRGARFAIYLGNDKVPALNLVVTPQDGNEPTPEPQARPQPQPAAAAATTPPPTPSPTKSNEAVQTENRRKGKYSSHAPVFQTGAELIQIIRYCKRCDLYMGSRREAVEHQKRKHDRKHCHCCFKLLRFSGNDWKDHMKAKHQDDSKERVKCPFCGDLQAFEGVYQHISRAHLKPVENGEEGEPPLLTPHPPKERAKKKDTPRAKETPRANETPRAKEIPRETQRKTRSSGRVAKETPTTGHPRITPEERLRIRDEKQRKERELRERENEPVAGPSPISQERSRQAAAAVKLPRPPPRTVPETAADRRRAAAAAEPDEPPAKISNLGNVQKESQARGLSPNTSYRNFQMVRQDYEKSPDINDANAHFGISQRVNAYLNLVFQQNPAPPDAKKYRELRAETNVEIENLKSWFERRYKDHCRAKNRK